VVVTTEHPLRILCCDPEGENRGGLSVALELLVQALLKAKDFELWLLRREPGGYRASCSGHVPQQATNLSMLLSQLNPDVMLGVGWHTWSEIAVRQAARRGLPIVFWSHGVGCLHWYRARPVQASLRWLLRAHRFIGVAATMCQLDHLVVAYARKAHSDPRSVDQALAKGLAKSVSAIGNPIDTSFWRPAEQPDCRRHLVVSVGRLEWQKGHAAALKILLQAPFTKAPLVCLAPVATPYGQKLQQLAARANASERLQLRFGLSAAQRRSFLQQATCLLSWSETEYQSLAMLEALACGCPVIARPRGWLCHAPIPGVLVTSSSRQASSWIDALEADPAWAADLGRQGRAYVVQHHSLVQVSGHWRTLLAALR
jgi:glycosyltransferase involved in cell wall biosynthesis